MHNFSSVRTSVRCQKLDDEVFMAGRDFRVRVPGLNLYVESGRPVVSILQPWKRLDLSEDQMALWGTFLDRSVFVEDLARAELELLDLSAPEGSDVRTVKVLKRSALPVLTDKELQERLELFLEAYELVLGAYERSRKYEEERASSESDKVLSPLPLFAKPDSA